MNNKDTEEITSQEETVNLPELDTKQSIKGGKQETFRLVIHIIAGAYLIYLAYPLFVGIRTGEISGTTSVLIMGGAGVLFVGCGGFILISGIRTALRNFKASMDAMAAMQEQDDKTSQQVDESEGYGYIEEQDDEEA